MKLLVVESPTKVKTLAKHLDDDWDFAVTKGHLYDLPKDRMGLDDEFNPEWVPLSKKRISKIRSSAGRAETVYLASDPDREGEAIAWQVDELVLDGKDTCRLRLESLTSDELEQHLNQPSTTDRELVEAQWARRILDRLAGYKISPFLISAFNGKKLSAGRVQTPVLGKIVDRWRDVEDFEPVKYYRLSFDWYFDDIESDESFRANLTAIGDRVIGTGGDESLLRDEDLVETLSEALRQKTIELSDCQREPTESYPRRPFDSSGLIQAASSWFSWSAGKTMNVAQSLYEKGLITYHRSDSNRLSQEACRQAAGFISDEYGKDYHEWRGGGGGDQEGHEAIRPKYPGLKPEELHSVSGSERTLYSAIWQVMIRSQMKPAIWDKLSLEFSQNETNSRYITELRALKKSGYYRCRRENESPKSEETLSVKEVDRIENMESFEVEEVNVSTEQTTGPSNYTEGSLVAMMKDEGIGRPSTYGSTIERLLNRQYIKRDGQSIIPTRRGRDVLDFLRRSIPKICEIDFTETMEQTLDRIASGEEEWESFVEQFDEKLEEWIESAGDVEPEGTAETEKELLEYEVCPRCEGDLYRREGQYGEFVHCDSDDCDFSSNPPAKTYQCPECDRHMVKDNGSNATVYHCIAEPDCSGKRPVGEPNMTLEAFREDAPDCPECEGSMEKRKGRYGSFWGCENYPECEATRSMD